MVFKTDIEPAADEALARIYSIVNEALNYKNDPAYIPCAEDMAILAKLEKKLLDAGELIQFLHVYFKGRITK